MKPATSAHDWQVAAGSALRGSIRVPGDKSISHRAIMLASIAEGPSRICGFLEGEDTQATAAAFQAMGVAISVPSADERSVEGVGLHGLSAPRQPLDCGNAGTAMRLLSGLLAGQSFSSALTGDDSLRRRPMRRVIEPLTQMGAVIDSQDGLPPLRIQGAQQLRGIDYSLPVASAQVKSAMLLAGLYATGETTVRESHPTRDYTESMLTAFGVPVRRHGNAVSVSGDARLRGRVVQIPADFSSAAFFLVAASLVPGSDLRITGVGLNPRRSGLLTTLIEMGADIETTQQRQVDGEAVADLRIRAAELHGVRVPRARVPDMIDEFPILFVAAALARGETLIEGAAELRIKESDRIGVMTQALASMGAAIEERPDGARISGVPALCAADVDSATDHRCAMSLAVAALRAVGSSRIRQIDNVATSFPGFEALAAGVGFDLVRYPKGS